MNNTKIKSVKTKKKPIQFANIQQNINKKKNTTKKIETETAKKKRKSGKKRNIILIAIMSILILIALGGLSLCLYIIITCPDFDTSKLFKSGSTIVYDADMNVIAELGVEKRENVTYDELPEVLVDAIVATEDAKFFQHDGIDLLRFGKATIQQLLGNSDAGGASTLTMQIVKNTYKVEEKNPIEKLMRKFKDIYMAVFKIEKTYTKQEIMEMYVNQGFLGNGAGGVEQASQVYFGKSVGELNLSEAALIAGLFQAPSAYDPYTHPDKAQNRRDQVLYLMVRHGYVTQEEANVAKAINVEDMLTGYSYSYSKYQGFIDTLVQEIIDDTGKDPAAVSMTIYSTMKADKQEVINQLYDGTLYKWKNETVNCGIAVTDVDTGAIVAIGAGRNKTGERQLNYATQIKRAPGSTAKPIFDYGPAIEYEGWGTGTTIVDDMYTYSTGQGLNNVDRGYKGIMMAKTALAQSRNIPALQAFQATSQEDKYEFVTNIGITPELHDGQILESASIGQFTGVSPLELSAAYGAFSRGGYYIKPYSYTKIEYNDSDETYTKTITRSKAMSEETAYMINMILKYAVTSGAVGTGSVSGTDIASKTGTSSVDAKALGLPSSSAIGDSWQVVYSPDYAIAFWYGYKSNTKEHYLTSNEGWNARRAIAKALTPRIMEKNSRWSKPSGVIAVEIEKESNPVQLASANTPDSLKSTEYFRKGTEPTEVSNRFASLSDVSNLTYTTIGNQIQLSWSPISTPDAIDEGYLQSYFETNYKNWAQKYYEKRLEYNRGNIGTVVYEVFTKNSDGSLYSLGTTSTNSFNTSITNGTSATFVVKSTYTIYKACASGGKEITVHVNPSFTPSIPDEDNETNTDE